MTVRLPLVVDIGPLREPYYTGIPNVIAEICSRLLREDWLDLYFNMDGHWVDTDAVNQCLMERSGTTLTNKADRFRPADEIRTNLVAAGKFSETVGLYTDHRPPVKT